MPNSDGSQECLLTPAADIKAKFEELVGLTEKNYEKAAAAEVDQTKAAFKELNGRSSASGQPSNQSDKMDQDPSDNSHRNHKMHHQDKDKTETNGVAE